MCIRGSAPAGVFGTQRPLVFLLAFDGQTDERLTVFTDNHISILFWALLTDCPRWSIQRTRPGFLRKEQSF
jgi:hypothetical protein